ncbi:MAG: hypothetical protein IJZ77_00670 [Bacilli bacterium]|nr:hypothetical protein [Bacilli bacterium]
MYLLKNLFIVSIGILFSVFLLIINMYFNISTLNYSDYYIKLFDAEWLNILIIIATYVVVYYICSLLNYLITNISFTNYYSFVIALLVGSFHYFTMYLNGVEVDLINFMSLISIEIFLSFFINYSTKYEKSV